ncbi:MAG TPA: methylmalonyl-CoA epimerase [Acidobacteriota bacterium]|nr:methylmalonyl-CoA epimerase [Acidobacteriota bacterium]
MTHREPFIEGLAHVGVAVRSLEEAVPRWTRSLGFRHVETITLDSMGLRIAFLESGGTEIELLEPARPDSVIAKFLEKRGEGIHHLSFHVRDIEAALARAVEAGVELIDRTPREGSHGAKIAFLHPRSMGGVLVEFCERRHE